MSRPDSRTPGDGRRARYRALIATAALLLLAACEGRPGEPTGGGSAASDSPALAPESAGGAASTAPPLLAVATPAPSPTLDAAAVARAATRAAITPSATPVPTPEPTPTATPLPGQRRGLGEAALALADYDAAITHFEIFLSANNALVAPADVQFDMGVAQLADGRFAAAVATFGDYLATAPDPDPIAHFHMAQARAGGGDCAGAITAYEAYLALDRTAVSYVEELIAVCYIALGDSTAAIRHYEAALAAPAHRLTRVEQHFALADLHLAAGNHAAAVTQYDAIHELAHTEFTRGQVTYLAGQALRAAGDEAGALERFALAVDRYPTAYGSYLSLVDLLDAGATVNEYQRGLIDYHAGAYAPAVEALQRHLDGADGDIRPDAYLYLAWSYEGLDRRTAALAAIDAYATNAPDDPARRATALLRRAELLARSGDLAGGAADLEQFLLEFPEHADAADNAYRLAEWTSRFAPTQAVDRYLAAADAYPGSAAAPEALFEAGLLAWRDDDVEAAVTAWQRAADGYPGRDYAAAALVWLLQTAPEEARAGYRTAATAVTRVTYYPLRARDVAAGTPPFAASAPDFAPLPVDAQATAEQWLREWLALPAESDLRGPDPVLRADADLARGRALWHMRQFTDARRELEGVRERFAEDARLSYQLALIFRDLGLYRSSIVAAATVLNASPDTIFNAPPFIGRLIYPAYFAHEVTRLAEQYGYDPLLQLALIRQESLFESFAESSAAASGLSQVIPSTGVYIAQRLNWPDYEDALLNRPVVGLAFGAYYLQEQLNFFDGDAYAALAAYNGGPGNAAAWRARAGDNPDLFLETVTFPETRQYIERIYVGHVIYRFLYSR